MAEGRGILMPDGSIRVFCSAQFRQECADEHKPGFDGVEVRIEVLPLTKREKTSPTLAYLFGHLAKVALNHLRNNGWTVLTKDSAVEKFKKPLGFVEILEGPDGATEEIPKSIANSSSVELYQFTEALYFYLLEAGEEVVHPDEYKAQRFSKSL